MQTENTPDKSTGTQPFTVATGQNRDFFAAGGGLLPHWQKLLQALEKIGPKKLDSRRKEAQRLLRENEATYNFFDAFEHQKSWQFDPVPLIISEDEWAPLEQGLIQRAKLLNLILADIYGPQLLLEKGLLPAELVFSHSGFLWPCVGLLPPTERHLHLYSANLTKDASGRFLVTEDRTQPVFGSGYALENRIVMTRSFPRLFRDFQVHRLAMYYRALRDSLVLRARNNKQDPRIVVLTPGPEHPTYFEHAYLASYLGYALVQGGDLIVRDGHVWLKSVGGLRQVDVILRRLDDDLCDPLELRGDSLFGIPGLLEAVRVGNVTTANAIGSSVLENPALLAFLPGLCRNLLGEELILPSVATWWCGQPRERDFVLQNLDKLVIKPIHPVRGLAEMLPGTLNEEQRTQRQQLILANPTLFVGQEVPGFTTIPSFAADRINTRPSILSTFLTARDQSYVVMPGGLTRIAPEATDLMHSHQERGCSKDTWVLTQEQDKQVNLWVQALPNQHIQPLFTSLPSRAAENLFWAGRYAERTEATARLLSSILLKLHDPDDQRSLDHLLRALTQVTSTFPGFVGKDADKLLADPRPELLSIANDVDRWGSLRSSLLGLTRSIHAVRDLVPADAWRVVDNMQKSWNKQLTLSQIDGARLPKSISKLVLQLSAFSGLTHENMSRETAWQLLNIGRRLERAINLIELLRATLVPCFEPTLEAQMMEIVLETSNSLVVFRRRYRSFMQLSTILELLLMDRNYPRALAYQLLQLQQHIAALPRTLEDMRPNLDEKLIADAIALQQETEHKQLTQLSGSDRTYPLLEKFLVAQKDQLEQLSEVMTQFYFSPTLVPRQLGAIVQGKKAS